ncbi:MAG TPA: galactokinase [Selenomonadales bacterium]|nr:galactokinase [Selenomonadales bacterium]
MTETAQMKNLFTEHYGPAAGPLYCYFAPGRVNLIGEHIDYNGGYVFPAAVSLGIYAAIRFRPDSVVNLKSVNAAGGVTVDLTRPIAYQEEDGWGNYPKGVLRYLQAEGRQLKGCDILFRGTLPDGAGLSSSAALLVLTAYMLLHANGETAIDRPQLARFCQRIENEFIQVNCGIMDQFAVAMGRKECAILLDCETLDCEYIPLALKSHSLIIMNTGKKRELTESRYNERRRECEQALAILRRQRPLKNLCQATLSEVEEFLPEGAVRKRARHVVSENGRVAKAIEFLRAGDILGFGGLLTASHDSLKNDYEVSGPELDAIVARALAYPGCIGARMTGAGFGGCAIALVEQGSAEAFAAAVAGGYQKVTGREPQFYAAGIGDGVKLLETWGGG